jgi:Peptidase A4 family
MTITQRRPVLTLAAALTLTVGFAAIEATSAAAQTVKAAAQASQNWAGYVASGQNFSSVSGSWTVPTANSSSNGYSAFWVGIGGASQQSQALEQVGTSSDVHHGQTTYYAWYELVPDPETRLNLAVHPGDQMTGKVTVNGSDVTISLTDRTTGQSVTKTLQDNNPDTSTAEWIAEAPSAETPSGGAQPLPLADFGKVTFTDASATAGGHTGSIGDPNWTAQPVDLTPSGSTGLLGSGAVDVASGGAQSTSAGASTGNLTDNGSSFSVSYSSDTGATQTSDPGSGYGYPGSVGGGGYGYGGGYPGYGGGYPGDGYGGGGSYYLVPGVYGYAY